MKLDNPKHEEFALLLARGVKQGVAYQKAGYAENKGAASRLAQSPVIQERVAQLKDELMDRVHAVLAVNTKDNDESRKDLGLTLDWVATQFKNIYENALAAGAFAPANTAVENIKKLIEMERNAKNVEDPDDIPKISMKDMMGVLDKVAGVIAASKEVPADLPMINITPVDA